jgi:small subunit ribosomal protein S8
MNVTDPVADMLTRVRNAIKSRHQKVDVPASKLKSEIASQKLIRIYLKYTVANQPAISNIERISRPGCRVYVGNKDIPKVLGGLGVNILTTPRGVMTGKAARQNGVGGELLCQVW